MLPKGCITAEAGCIAEPLVAGKVPGDRLRPPAAVIQAGHGGLALGDGGIIVAKRHCTFSVSCACVERCLQVGRD